MNKLLKLIMAAALVLATGQSISQGKDIAARQAAKAAAEAKRTETKEARAAAKEKRQETLTDKAETRTEARQAHQAKRIEEGIKKGYLTADEINKLEGQQKSIETLQQSLMSDGIIRKDEAKQLRNQLNDASLCIFAEKHDADGKTKSVLRLGKNVTLKANVAQKLGDASLSKPDARTFLKDFNRIMMLKKTLSGTASDADRTSMQTEYNTLLNKYFDSK